MRTINRNKRPVAYAFYQGMTDLTDDDGNYTGETDISYSEPTKTLMNVSGGRGQADIALFGLAENFSVTVVTDDLDTPFDTETVFWIYNDPDTEEHDYRVIAVARTINQVVLALEEVDKSSTPSGGGTP